MSKANKNILDQLKLNERAEISEEYFNDFSDKVFDKIHAESNVHLSKLSVIYRKPIFWISIAASLFILVTVNSLNGGKEVGLSDLSSDEIHAYLSENIEDLEEEHLVSTVNNDKLTQHQISKDEILDYLNNEEVELEF